MIAILTEKPSVGKEIARVIGATQNKNGYLEGNGYAVTWAFGHLVTLALPEDYGIKDFAVESLPILPNPFKFIPRKKKTAKGYVTDPGVKKQLEVIKTVFSKCERIIVATDAAREGECIFRYIYHFLKCKKPFSRLWISSLTDYAIKEGFKNLKDGKDYDSLYFAAEARSKADWIVGINASKALQITSGEGNNSLGRVQTPTLTMICSRYVENRNFKSDPYWQLAMKVRKDDTLITIKGLGNLFNKNEADNIFNHLKTYPLTRITRIESKEVSTDPPLLHDLTSLQKEANIRHGFSAEKSLDIAQKLYEKKFTTYPRTGSKYITNDIFETIPTLIESMILYPPFSANASRFPFDRINKKSVDEEKVTDHHALLITGIPAKNLSEDEKIIYDMIAGRMLEAFSPPCIKDVTNVEFSCDDLIFRAKGWSIKENGWKDVFRLPDEEETEENQLLPPLSEGELLPIESHSMIQKHTKPKPLFTEAGLLAAMETCGKTIEDEEKRAAIKETGIGTPATRAGIIETLFTRGYIDRDKKNLIPTKKGMYIYNTVKDMRIADVEMTAGWESMLLNIEKDPAFFLDSFMNGIKVHAKQIVDEIISIRMPQESNIESTHICPKCKRGKMLFYNKISKCNNSTCRLTLFRNKCGNTLTDEHLNELLKKGKTPVIKGFVNKSGHKFDASLTFDDGFNLSFIFPDKNTGNKVANNET